MAQRLSLLLLLLGAFACRPPTLVTASGDLSFAPDSVDLGETIAGLEEGAVVELRNAGRSGLTVSWTLPPGPFVLEGENGEPLPSQVPSGGLRVRVRFRSPAVGAFEARFTARASDENFATLSVRATAVPIDCGEAPPCFQRRFDLSKEACVEEPLAEGTACDAKNACVEGPGSCQQGRCVGPLKVCDDGNACTRDACHPVDGCVTAPAPDCPSDRPCQVGVCNPLTGCGYAPAADGTSCGNSNTCDAADICLSGQCVTEDPPDGFLCVPSTPCGGEGRCNGSVCEQRQPGTLAATWTFDADATVNGPVWSDAVLAPGGQTTLLGFFAEPRLGAEGAQPAVASATARRCLLWGARLACADYGGNGKVAVLDPGTGALQWTFDAPASQPAFAALTRSFFMARLAVLSSDRLAALFEAYPAGSPDPTGCRLYFLVVLDAAGNVVGAARLQDPLLDVCDHPHPYGFAADALGELFMAFSGTVKDEAPLVPGSPTLLISYSRDGTFRWKRTESFQGGELAVAKGALYPENAAQPFAAAQGTPLPAPGTSGAPLGRVVVTDNLFVTSPATAALTGFDAQALHGYEFGQATPAWSYRPPEGSFFSDQLRLARWRPNAADPAQTVALFFRGTVEAPLLTAVRTADGTEAWSCPVSAPLRSSPQLFEVANGKAVVMSGAGTCGRCDPPFAYSRSLFHGLALPGVETAEAPWVGPFGGAGHDHREDGVPE